MGYEEKEEFLRKIFNVSIRIKGLNNIDRFDFTKNLIEKYCLGFSNEVASVISQEFAKNPRRIIQFLNSLAIEQEVAREQEVEGNIPKESVTENIDFLAKILLLKEEYSFLYDKILFDGLNLSSWEDLYKNDENDTRKEREKNELKMFFGRTSGIITPKNIRPYLMLHSKDALISQDLVNLIQAGNPEKVVEKVNEQSLDFNMLLDYLNDQLDTKLIKRGIAANLELSFLIWCFGQKDIDQSFQQRKTGFYRYFGEIKSEHIGNFSSPDLIKCAQFLKTQNREGLYNSIISYINSDADFKAQDLMEFIAVFHTMQDLNKIADRINKVMADDVNICKSLIPYLKKAKTKQGYIKSETINKHIAALTAKRTENDKVICEITRFFLSANLLPSDIHNAFLQNIMKFLKTEQSPACYKFWVDNIEGCMKVDAEGAQLIQWINHSFNSTVFTNRANNQWKEVLVSMVKIMKECFIIGDNSVWQSIAKVYNLTDDLGLVANSSLQQIVVNTDPDKWNFLDNVIAKTSSMGVAEDYFIVLGEILEKVFEQDIVKSKPALLKNWLNYIVIKKNVGDNEKGIFKQYCKNEVFKASCKENLELAKALFKKAMSVALREVIDSIADIILDDPSPADIKYLIENKYEPIDNIKKAIQNNINFGSEEIEWIKIVIDSEDIWTDLEYKKALEEKLVHLATGTHDQKKQAKKLWENVSQDKISSNKKSIIEKGISEVDETDNEGSDEKDSKE